VDAGEVLRQTSAVIGRPVTLWEVTGPHEAVPRATSSVGAPPPFNLDTTLRRWNVPIPVGSLWIATPAPASDAGDWVVAPVRSRPPSPPPGGRERRSRDRLALELAGLALGAIESPGPPTGTAAGVMVHQASNPLTAARAGLQLAMESIGRSIDLAADRRLTLLDDLGEVLEDIDRTSEYLRVMKETARSGAMTARGERGGRFDAVRVVRSCLTLERRLLRDRGIELEFTTSRDTIYLKGDPNALFDLLVNLVRRAADPVGERPTPVRVQLEHKGKNLELVVRGRGKPLDLAKIRIVAEDVFGGTMTSASPAADETITTIVLPLPPQREVGS
jgi:signal transduction histidine kinase